MNANYMHLSEILPRKSIFKCYLLITSPNITSFLSWKDFTDIDYHFCEKNDNMQKLNSLTGQRLHTFSEDQHKKQGT